MSGITRCTIMWNSGFHVRKTLYGFRTGFFYDLNSLPLKTRQFAKIYILNILHALFN